MAKKILVVDDSQTDNEAICMILQSGGYTTVKAFDGESGVEMSKKEKPDLVVMDIVMPGINGFQACKLIVKDPDTASIPVVICSNKHQETDKAWGLRNGAKHYFVKPVDARELLSKVKELIGE